MQLNSTAFADGSAILDATPVMATTCRLLERCAARHPQLRPCLR
jgi:hypothetical protein